MTDRAEQDSNDGDPEFTDNGDPALTDNADPALDESSRSAAACPRCGAHRLALLTLPQIDTSGYRPLDEIYGMVSGPTLEEPGIGCLACGAEWPDLAAFDAETSA